MKSFIEVFRNYIDVSKLPAALTESIVSNTVIYSQERTMTIRLEAAGLISRSDIFAAEDMICRSVLALYSCRIEPHYDSTLFDTEYYLQLVLELKRRNASLNGTLNDSSAEIIGKEIIIDAFLFSGSRRTRRCRYGIRYIFMLF